MALTTDIEVYKHMYSLLLMLMDARNNFDKPYKYVVGERVVNTALDCVELIRYANEDRREGARVQHLDDFMLRFGVMKTLIMVCRDRHQFKNTGVMADIFVEVAEVELQIAKWRRAAKKA